MRIAWTKPLFAWDCLDDHPTLKTLAAFLASVPDGKLLEALRRHRGRGRDDHPVHQLWGVVLLRVVLRHTSFAATLGELRRNEGLRRLLGIETEEDVPDEWNVSRFLVVLGTEPYLTMVHEIFNTMVRRLAEAVPDLGRHLAGDSTGLSARPGRAKKDNPDGLPEPAGGRKEYTDEEGKVVKVIEWFGYKLHLLADTRHEVAVAYKVGSTKEGDNEALAEHGIRPVIEVRALWKDEKERMLPGHDGTSNVVYDEAGTVYCYDKTQDPPVRHRMAYIGHEPARGTVKYRCPARHGDWRCPSDARCNAGKSYGKTVRIRCEEDLRRFPAIPRATKQFERLYRGRTAVERVNGRLKVFWGADDGNLTGARRFHAQVGVVMIVHVGLATVLASAPRREGTLDPQSATCTHFACMLGQAKLRLGTPY